MPRAKLTKAHDNYLTPECACASDIGATDHKFRRGQQGLGTNEMISFVPL